MKSPATHRPALSAAFIATALAAAGPLVAQEFAPEEPVAPEGLTDADFEPLRRTSPFTRVLSLPDAYALRGVATIDGSQVVTLYNRATKESFVVTPEGSGDSGLALVGVAGSPSLEEVAAKIAFAGDEAELKYEESQLHPEPKDRRSGSSRSGSSGEGERRGPSPQDIERFRALPEEQQGKLREYIGAIMRNYPDLSRTERGNMIRGAMVRLMDGRDLEIPQPSQQGQGGGDSASGRTSEGRGGPPPGVRIEARSGGSGGRTSSGRGSDGGSRGERR